VPAYDGAKLAAAGPAVVVTFNYRLGTLGYLMHPRLAAESSDGRLATTGSSIRWRRSNSSSEISPRSAVTRRGC
jgi:para-nitrobenzyl esterase